MSMTVQEAAAALDGCQYREERKAISFADMKVAGLVAVYGASDDLIEFDGAIHDEAGCYNGGEVYVTKTGLVQDPDCDCDAARKLHEMGISSAHLVKALWCPDGLDCSWAYETKIPHATFKVMEDDELYCIGFVFDTNNMEPNQ